MAQEYLQQLTALIRQSASGRFKGVKLECKHFFSGAAVYAIKLPEESRNILLNEKGAKPLRYFPKGPIKKDYVVLPNAMLKDVKVLRRWVKISIEYVLSLPRSLKKGK